MCNFYTGGVHIVDMMVFLLLWTTGKTLLSNICVVCSLVCMLSLCCFFQTEIHKMAFMAFSKLAFLDVTSSGLSPLQHSLVQLEVVCGVFTGFEQGA